MTKGSRWRRALLLGVWVWILCEVGAWATVRALEGEPISRAALHSRQLSLADQELRAHSMGPKARKRTHADRGIEYRHPYLGFVSKDSDIQSDGITHLMSADLGNPDAACFQEETFVVGIAGGSVAADLVDTYGKQLLRKLKASPLIASRDVVLIDLASSGHKQPQALISYLFLDSLGVRFDAVMVLDGFNEVALHVGAAARANMLPAYPRQWVSRLSMGLAEGSLLARIDIQKARRANAAEAILGSPLELSWIRQLAWYQSNRALDQRIQFLGEALDSSGELDVERTGPPRIYASLDEQLEDLVGIWKRSSRALFQMCQASDTIYLHFLQPNQYLVRSKPMGPEESGIALNLESKYAQRIPLAYPLLQAAGAQLTRDGVLFHDLTNIFAEVQQPIYMDTCCHLNRKGSRLMGQVMLEALLATLR